MPSPSEITASVQLNLINSGTFSSGLMSTEIELQYFELLLKRKFAEGMYSVRKWGRENSVKVEKKVNRFLHLFERTSDLVTSAAPLVKGSDS